MPVSNVPEASSDDPVFTRYHLGCGTVFLKNWLNIGYWTHLDDDGVYDIEGAILLNHDLRLGIPAKESSLAAVYHSHLLEHLNYKDGLDFISEVHRVMRPGPLHSRVIMAEVPRGYA